ncbi:hypothetical protein Vi05172_g13266 [Venturia inaequalis]|nr:hypothetical protein Vi05172_g13266 [Venturia inaequalis]
MNLLTLLPVLCLLASSAMAHCEKGALGPCLDWCYAYNAKDWGGKRVPLEVINRCSKVNCDTC